MSDLRIDPLEWDSGFFGMRIGKLPLPPGAEVTELEKAISAYNGEVVYIFSPAPVVTQVNGMKLVDRKVVYTKPVSATGKNDPHVRPIAGTDENLEKLAILSGQYSRFLLDPVFAPHFERMYTIWLTRSVNREIAGEVYGYYEEDVLKGFVTVGGRSPIAVIGLIAVDEGYQGRGAGRKLVEAVENWCAEKGYATLDVATQLDNVQACRFYERYGFAVREITYIYHYHRQKNGVHTVQ
jgi:dTDP-4-amino-4,6-dideoxy-D-galactose acyltransferase